MYDSGHGVEIRGANYLVPRDVPTADTIKQESGLRQLLLSIDDGMQDLKHREVALAVLILDACRDNPFSFESKTLGGAGGLVPPGTRLGRFVFYAASAHETALPEHPGQPVTNGSIFTRVFLEQFDSYKHRELRDFAAALKRPVTTLADPHPQHPTYEDGLDSSWCFDGCAGANVGVAVLAGDHQIAQVGSTGAVASAVKQAQLEQSTTLSFIPESATVPPNAIFLGKSSSLASAQECGSKVTDALPFGCGLLRQIVSSEDLKQSRDYLRRPLRPETDVNVRKRIPTVNEKSQGIYSCVVGVLSPKDQATLAGVVRLDYAGDRFYWGLLDAPPRDCVREAARSR